MKIIKENIVGLCMVATTLMIYQETVGQINYTGSGGDERRFPVAIHCRLVGIFGWAKLSDWRKRGRSSRNVENIP